MSQAGILSTSAGPVPPEVPTSFVTDNGTAIPVANVLNVLGRDVNTNNDNGIQTTADPNGGDNLYVELTNRNTGTVTTTDATPTTLMSVSLGATPGVFIAEGNLLGYNTTDLAGGAYTFTGAAVTTGAAATEISVEEKDVFEQAAMAAADFDISVSGNNIVVTVTGIAGKTINWSGYFLYRFVG